MRRNSLCKNFPEIILVFCFVIESLSVTPVFAAADFQNLDQSEDSSNFEELPDESSSPMPEIEAEQHDLRLDRPNGLGLGVGALMPYVSVLVEYQRGLDTHSGFFGALGRGLLKSTSQESGEQLVTNRLKTSAADAGYIWWPSKNFPFAVTGLLGLMRADGEVESSESSTGQYKLVSLGVGLDIRVQNIFENGFFLKWVLLSARHMRVISEQHSDVSRAKLASTRDRFSGLKLLGITNLTIGYMW